MGLPRLLASLLPLLLCACAAPPPRGRPPVPVEIPKLAAPVTSAAPLAVIPTKHGAVERIIEWERHEGSFSGHEIEKRQRSGAFVLGRATSILSRTGAVATDAGILDGIRWDDILLEDSDVDGDGRNDLVLYDARKDAEPSYGEVHVIADRPEGPVELPVEGFEPASWFRAEASGAPGFVLHTGDLDHGHQAFAWNGHALVARETELLWWKCSIPANGWGARCNGMAVAGGKRKEIETDGMGHLERMDPPDGTEDVWNLHGDGARFYIAKFTESPPPWEGRNSVIHHLVYELRPEGWVEGKMPPVDLETMQDRDGDGKPEFERARGKLRLAQCQKASRACEQEAFEVDVHALSAWDGHDYGMRQPWLRAAYAPWAAEARQRAADAAGGLDGKSDCPVSIVDAAARVYLGARWSGATEEKALAEADAVMKGYSTAACTNGGAKPRPWGTLRGEMVKMLAGAVPAP